MRTTSSILCVITSFIAAGQNQISITELVILSGISRQRSLKSNGTKTYVSEVTV
ncbi:MarR family transcriptional regulator [Escherichia coli]|nr:MarR family transcriptional regulator [Escherichia coli]EEV5733268.1 MarR family transcriptional regulator [Escherichia coli]EEV6567680.1 MarR family transcriptional regulator [Escherichia coli]EEV7462679.1 MarR family transcriptional regulator [Escherichia coli]EEV9335433.1 MarR family transcriptional regulator [Escherichia coli]